jgi:pilus assembly protein CpaB
VSLRTILIVVLALVFGGAAAVLANRLVNRGQSGPSETVPVIVAAGDIPRGTIVSADMVTVDNWPKDKVLPSMITTVEDATDRATLIPLVKGEVLLDSKLTAKGAGGGMAGLTRKGMRAVTIQTPNVSSGVAGFILPGNKVDVLLTVSRSGQDDTSGGGITVRLLQNIEVVAVDQHLDARADTKVDPKGMRSVTLMVSPDQDAKLALAQTMGTLHLSLRNSQDSQAANTKPVTLAGLRFLPEKPGVEPKKPDMAPPAVKKPKPRPRPVEIRTLRGNHAGAVQFD